MKTFLALFDLFLIGAFLYQYVQLRGEDKDRTFLAQDLTIENQESQQRKMFEESRQFVEGIFTEGQ